MDMTSVDFFKIITSFPCPPMPRVEIIYPVCPSFSPHSQRFDLPNHDSQTLVHVAGFRVTTYVIIFDGLRRNGMAPFSSSVRGCRIAPTILPSRVNMRRSLNWTSFPGRHPLGRCFILLVLALLVSGCSSDPNAKKQKFMGRGNEAFDQGKYAEALIFYGRALQVDRGYPEAHYKLAQTHLKMGSWAAAYQELNRTIELKPENWKAQQELGQVELAAGKRQEAKDRALLILRSNPNQADAQILLANADAALGNLQEGAILGQQGDHSLHGTRRLVSTTEALPGSRETVPSCNPSSVQGLRTASGPRRTLPRRGTARSSGTGLKRCQGAAKR